MRQWDQQRMCLRLASPLACPLEAGHVGWIPAQLHPPTPAWRQQMYSGVLWALTPDREVRKSKRVRGQRKDLRAMPEQTPIA